MTLLRLFFWFKFVVLALIVSPQAFAQGRTEGGDQPGYVPNAQDGIYQGGGDQLLIGPTPNPSGDGYAVTFEVGLQMS